MLEFYCVSLIVFFMVRNHIQSTRIETPFPYTTLFRSFAGRFGCQLVLRVYLVDRLRGAARAFEHLLFIGAREVDRPFAFLPRRGDFLERLVDLARRVV